MAMMALDGGLSVNRPSLENDADDGGDVVAEFAVKNTLELTRHMAQSQHNDDGIDMALGLVIGGSVFGGTVVMLIVS